MIQVEIDRLEERLANWARCMWPGGPGQARCASAEGQYVPPRADEERMVRQARTPLDIRDGAFMEEAVTSLALQRDRLIITYTYLLGRQPKEIARKLKFHVDQYEDALAISLQRLSDRIAQMESVKLIRRGRPLWAGVAK